MTIRMKLDQVLRTATAGGETETLTFHAVQGGPNETWANLWACATLTVVVSRGGAEFALGREYDFLAVEVEP